MPRRSRVIGELRRRVADLERDAHRGRLLAEFTQVLHACQATDEAYAVVGRTMPGLFDRDAGALFELRPGRPSVLPVVAWGSPPPVQRVFAPDDCWALRRGSAYLIDDTGVRLRCRHVDEPIRVGQLCVPLTAHHETLGVLHLQVRRRVEGTARRNLLADRQRLAVSLAEDIALALANIRLRDVLREQSSRDALTGLFNRRYMEESLDRELRRAAREGYSLGLIMADLDHLKAFNDAYGHAVGDAVLQAVGSFLLSAIRREDIACRFGGEEFVIILPKATLEETQRRAEVLRRGLAEIRVDALTPDGPAVTMSAGVAAFPDHGAGVDVLLHRADEALYRAKAAGRNRVALAATVAPQGIDVLAEPGATRWSSPGDPLAG